jgi:hypothetical protein
MDLTSISNIIVSGISGGVGAAMINLIKEYTFNRKKREVEVLTNKLEKLYASLYFWIGRNKSYLEHYKRIHKAYDEEFNKNFSDDDLTQKRLTRDIETTIEIGNDYIHLIEQSYDNIINIIKDNYSYADLEDIPIFQRFMLDCERLKIERNENKILKTPGRIYNNLEKSVGEMTFLRPEMIECVENKYIKYKNKLEKL